MVLLLILGIVAGISLIAVVGLGLSWRHAGPVAAEAKRNVQPLPAVEPLRELPPIARPRQSIELEHTADLFSINREFTVELWARFHPAPDARSLIGTQVSLEDGGSAGWLLHIPGPAFKDKNRYITMNGEFRFGAHLPDSESDWQHLAVCGRAGSLHVFVNGSHVLLADSRPNGVLEIKVRLTPAPTSSIRIPELSCDNRLDSPDCLCGGNGVIGDTPHRSVGPSEGLYFRRELRLE